MLAGPEGLSSGNRAPARTYHPCQEDDLIGGCPMVDRPQNGTSMVFCGGVEYQKPLGAKVPGLDAFHPPATHSESGTKSPQTCHFEPDLAVVHLR
jgi:hypothetical protein